MNFIHFWFHRCWFWKYGDNSTGWWPADKGYVWFCTQFEGWSTQSIRSFRAVFTSYWRTVSYWTGFTRGKILRWHMSHFKFRHLEVSGHDLNHKSHNNFDFPELVENQNTPASQLSCRKMCFCNISLLLCQSLVGLIWCQCCCSTG